MSLKTAHKESIWIYPEDNIQWSKDIVKEFRIHPAAATVLAARKFTSNEQIHSFLYAKLPDLHEPDLLEGMDRAVERVLEAMEKKERILILGDNDVDGITGTALLTEFFRFLGVETHFYIPNRIDLKQSVLNEAARVATERHCKLLITVDCGITSAAEIEKAVSQGIDVIVTDHHEPTHRLPHCIATLNPKLFTSQYPNRDLTGVGVAFKLAHAVANMLIETGKISPTRIDLKRYLDLVALGTIADMGALRGENRIFVRYGLKQMRKTKRVGLVKLYQVCDLIPEELTTLDLAAKLAPRINSLGRIDDPNKGVDLLLLRDAHLAEQLAKELDLNNSERQKIERRDSEEVDQILQNDTHLLDNKALVLASKNWHPGVIPIICARISKLYNRPTIIISIENDVGKGSIRTIPEFPLLPVLRENASLLINFGGHDYAAGLTIDSSNIDELKKKFIEKANSMLSADDLQTKIYLDAPISFNDLTFEFMDSLSLMEPFGHGNPPPLFYTKAEQAWFPKVVGKTHLKFYLQQGDRTLEGIGFNMGHYKDKLSKKNLKLLVAFTPQINNFLNKTSIQLLIKAFQII